MRWCPRSEGRRFVSAFTRKHSKLRVEHCGEDGVAQAQHVQAQLFVPCSDATGRSAIYGRFLECYGQHI